LDHERVLTRYSRKEINPCPRISVHVSMHPTDRDRVPSSVSCDICHEDVVLLLPYRYSAIV
ncbi:MAG TPA: hypothetical protein QF905_01660, partial [Acidimicrobiales bacterium]|nr:hypothetical protein [Acidimicrobiales bacterium]